MKKVTYFLIFAIIAIMGFTIISHCSNTEPKSSVTFESIVSNDYNYVDSAFNDTVETHFYEVRAYMPERIDSAAVHGTQIDSITTIFAVGLKVYVFNHKIKGDSVTTDTCVYRGPFVEDCEMPWPLPLTFNQMMQIVKEYKLSAPNKDIALRRALIAHPKDFPDFTIYGGRGDKWWFISTKNGSVRTDQNSEAWLKQYNQWK